MSPDDRSGVISFEAAQACIAGPEGGRSALHRGTLDIRLSMPQSPTIQSPHEQDEIYVIVRGRGVFVHDGRRTAFKAGDILFVAAGVAHHYEQFSSDLALWRVFYGARGAEVASQLPP